MSTDSMDESANPTRTRAVSISDMMMSLNTKGPGAATDGATVGECLLDTLCVKYLGMSAGLTIYEDSLYTNMISEFSLKDFFKENQIRSPVVRTQYAEVQEIDMNFRDGHAEEPDMQKKVNDLNAPRLPPPVSL